MENESHKLTASQRTRYDRGMSEAATAEVMDKDQVRDAWAGQLSTAKDPATRSAIQAAINIGYTPQNIPGEVDEMTKKYVEGEFKKIQDRDSKERKRTPVEQHFDKYVEEIEKSEMKGSSQPPAEIILRDKKGWSEFGWGDADKSKVENKFKGLFGLNDNQLKNIIELMVSTGKSAKDVAEEIEGKSQDFEPNLQELQNARGSREKAISLKKLAWFSEFGIRESYVERFVLENEFHDELEQEFQGTDPANIEEIAWQITHYKFTPGTWGLNDNFPILEMRIDYVKDDNGNIIKDSDGKSQVDKEKSKYYVNQANFVRWARERMWSVYDQNPDAEQNFFSSINLPKSYRPLDFGTMFQAYSKYFASEDGETKYGELAQELLVEAAALSTIRSWDSAYKESMGDPKKLMETLGKLFAGNAFTKETFRKNLFNLLTIVPLNFEGSEKGKLPRHDGIFGSAVLDIFLSYYNLTDFDELQKIWGKGSSFFTKEGYLGAFQTVVNDKVRDSSGEHHPTILNAENQEYFDKAFDANGEVTSRDNKANFIKLLNFFAVKMNNSDSEYAVRRLLYRAVSEKYGKVVGTEKIGDKVIDRYALTDAKGNSEDEWSLKMAWVAGASMGRVFGAGARNDTLTAGYDFLNKLHYTQTYRDKMINKNGDAAGNPYTVPQFKMLAVDPFNAILTESYTEDKDEHGNIKMKRNKDGKLVPVLRAKSTMEVLREMQSTMTAYNSQLKQLEKEYEIMPEGSEKTARKMYIDKFREEMNFKYQDNAGELAFKQRAMSNYSEDHLNRAFETYNLIIKADEVNMEDYVHYDAWGGVHFKRAKFQEDIQEKMIHPIRYFLNTYPDLNYNQTIKALDQTATIREHRPIYRDMPLGEAMFGHELLNREAFWKKDPKTHKPICMEDGKGRKMKGIYEIDYDKVNDNKTLLWKQFLMTKISADLWSHRAFHSTDNRFDLNYYKNVIGAIESIPGALQSDQYSIRQQVVSKKFFDKRDMAWFKKTAKVENYDLYLRAIFKDMFLPDDPAQGIGLMEALSFLTRQIVRQGG